MHGLRPSDSERSSPFAHPLHIGSSMHPSQRRSHFHARACGRILCHRLRRLSSAHRVRWPARRHHHRRRRPSRCHHRSRCRRAKGVCESPAHFHPHTTKSYTALPARHAASPARSTSCLPAAQQERSQHICRLVGGRDVSLLRRWWAREAVPLRNQRLNPKPETQTSRPRAGEAIVLRCRHKAQPASHSRCCSVP